MMWSRLSALLSCVLLLLVSCPHAFCQTQQGKPIKGFLSVDSTGIQTTQVSTSMEPVRIGLSGSEPKMGTSGGETAPGSIQLKTLSKCHWVRFHFSGTRWKWLVRKPGSYAAKTLTGCIRSNGEILVDFCRFNRLRCSDGSEDFLETYYAISSPNFGIGELTWMTPNELNNYQMHLGGSPIVPYLWALWQKIVVDKTAKAAEFQDKGIISIKLLNNGIWIEGVDSGEYPAAK
jgi:hypothetical protein